MFKNLVFIYLIIINLTVFFMMYYDKKQARKRKWRVPEFNLLFLGLIGGGIGGLLGQQLFHHKTKKLRFYLIFGIGAIFAIAVTYFIIVNK